MATLRKEEIRYTLHEISERESVILSFDWAGGYMDWFDLPQGYSHRLWCSVKKDGEEYGINDLFYVELENFPELIKVIDDEDCLPNWRLDYINEENDIEENDIEENDILLRDFVKKYLIDDGLFEKLQKEYLYHGTNA